MDKNVMHTNKNRSVSSWCFIRDKRNNLFWLPETIPEINPAEGPNRIDIQKDFLFCIFFLKSNSTLPYQLLLFSLSSLLTHILVVVFIQLIFIDNNFHHTKTHSALWNMIQRLIVLDRAQFKFGIWNWKY